MGRKNHRGGRPQARRKADGSRGGPPAPQQPVEALVIPQGRCHQRHRKFMFAEADVAKALRQAQAKRRLQTNGHVEERAYHCKTEEGGCGAWHLTSRKEWNPPRRTA